MFIPREQISTETSEADHATGARLLLNVPIPPSHSYRDSSESAPTA